MSRVLTIRVCDTYPSLLFSPLPGRSAAERARAGRADDIDASYVMVTLSIAQ